MHPNAGHYLANHSHSRELARPGWWFHIAFMLRDEQTSPEQIVALRALTGAQRWRLAEQLYWSARKMKRAGMRYQHPDWPEERLDEEVRRIFSQAET